MKKNKKNRRQFLRNTSLAALALGVLPHSSAASKTAEGDRPLTCEVTTLDYYGEGPFYTENPPQIEANQLAEAAEAGQRLIITGRVFNLSCNQYIPNTIIDVWHANDAGQYDNQGYNLRGQTTTNEEGFYVFETIKPGKYLNGNSYRPSHIHFKITPPDFPTMITQLYFDGDTDIAGDAAASITSGTYDATHRIIPLTENADGKLEGTWDIVIDGQGVIVGATDLHLDKGMIYQVNPTIFTDSLVVKYGIFKSAKVGLSVFDMAGRLVAVLEDQILPADKYEAEWQPQKELPKGYYFIALKINDLQVHYLKVVKQ